MLLHGDHVGHILRIVPELGTVTGIDYKLKQQLNESTFDFCNVYMVYNSYLARQKKLLTLLNLTENKSTLNQT